LVLADIGDIGNIGIGLFSKPIPQKLLMIIISGIGFIGCGIGLILVSVHWFAKKVDFFM
jgi:hypothetical protein